jgi:hypothetical protein
LAFEFGGEALVGVRDHAIAGEAVFEGLTGP